jgi:hypothetical protein
MQDEDATTSQQQAQPTGEQSGGGASANSQSQGTVLDNDADTDKHQRVLRSQSQAVDSQNKGNKGATPRVYACNVCHTKHMKPTGAKCPFGPPQADESQETPAAQAAASQQVQSDILMSSATLNKFTDVLQVITSRLDVIETRLDNGGGALSTCSLPACHL